MYYIIEFFLTNLYNKKDKVINIKNTYLLWVFFRKLITNLVIRNNKINMI